MQKSANIKNSALAIKTPKNKYISCVQVNPPKWEHFLESAPLNWKDVSNQTQRKQSSTPKPQSEFSANVWASDPFNLVWVNGSLLLLLVSKIKH